MSKLKYSLLKLEKKRREGTTEDKNYEATVITFVTLMISILRFQCLDDEKMFSEPLPVLPYLQ